MTHITRISVGSRKLPWATVIGLYSVASTITLATLLGTHTININRKAGLY